METDATQWASNEEPIYNIGVVARMTGIPVATLRVWERRYEFPQSSRTPGGHRLYSEQELVRLRWVKASIDQGMQTSQAILALRSRERRGGIPELGPTSAPAISPFTNGTALAKFHERLTAALLGHDLAQAEQLLGEILALYSMEDVILNVIRPTLVDIGEGWLEGDVNIATEHLASQFLVQRLMMWMVTGPQTHPVRPVVLACAPDEWHEVSLLMLGVLLRRRRWPVAYLGQALPLPDLAQFVRDMRPPVVVLVSMREESARKLLPLPEFMPEALEIGRPAVAYGGRGFAGRPDLQAAMAGTYLGDSLQEGLQTLERLLLEASALPM